MEFIKNVLEVEVDSLRGVNHYKISAMYNKKVNDEQGEYYDIETKMIDEFDYTWKQINQEGGIGAVNEEIKTLYNIAE